MLMLSGQKWLQISGGMQKACAQQWFIDFKLSILYYSSSSNEQFVRGKIRVFFQSIIDAPYRLRRKFCLWRCKNYLIPPYYIQFSINFACKKLMIEISYLFSFGRICFLSTFERENNICCSRHTPFALESAQKCYEIFKRIIHEIMCPRFHWIFNVQSLTVLCK